MAHFRIFVGHTGILPPHKGKHVLYCLQFLYVGALRN